MMEIFEIFPIFWIIAMVAVKKETRHAMLGAVTYPYAAMIIMVWAWDDVYGTQYGVEMAFRILGIWIAILSCALISTYTLKWFFSKLETP